VTSKDISGLILAIRSRSEPYPAGDSQGHHSNVGNQSLDNGPARERELYAWLLNERSSHIIKHVYDSVVNNPSANHTCKLPCDTCPIAKPGLENNGHDWEEIYQHFSQHLFL